ncbi:MAG: hypothetical protein A2Z18_04835 [Armatimonadetes bacterium RBG_16_58_9]|nr:MAG: hypothetical protein A2Z18_04835 [Armatimonadetes bacterium RBG_16_58_9]
MTSRANAKVWIYRWGPTVACMAALFYLSAQPYLPDIPKLGFLDMGDKSEHFVAYAVLGALIWRALSSASPKLWRICATVAVATAYGLSDESHQILVPGRKFDLLDLGADALGSAVAAAVLTLWIGGNRFGKEERGRAGEDVRSEGQKAGERQGHDQGAA